MSAPSRGDRAGAPTTLRRSLRRALTVAGVALGLFVLFALVSVVQVVRAQQDVTDLYYRAVTEANDGYIRIIDAETAVRGYALTADPAALEPFTRVLGGADGGAPGDLEDRLAADVELIEARDVAVEAARVWFVEYAQPTVDAVEAGGVAAVGPEDLERGRVLFQQTRDAVESYLDAIRVHRAEALVRLELWTRLLVASTGALVLGVVAVGGGLWVVLGRRVTGPLAALAADAREVGSGVLTHPVRTTGPGEIAALAADVETMRQVLVQQVHAAAAASAELTDAHRRLTEQAEELQRSNRDLEQFAYVASHDLQEPLRKVASFTQLLQNLVGNAVKFADPSRPPRVHLSARRTGDHWEVECRDNGIGIDQQYADRGFIIFQRLHAKEAYEGTGIGLSLCKKIVEHHGGRIWLDQNTEGGTSFRFTLPARMPGEPGARAGAPAVPTAAERTPRP